MQVRTTICMYVHITLYTYVDTFHLRSCLIVFHSEVDPTHSRGQEWGFKYYVTKQSIQDECPECIVKKKY